MVPEKDLEEAHHHSMYNEKEILKSEICGCFSCMKMFPPSEITEWAAWEIERGAVCPYCTTDSVIGSASGFPITREFLQRMKDYWFASVKLKGFKYKVSRHFAS